VFCELAFLNISANQAENRINYQKFQTNIKYKHTHTVNRIKSTDTRMLRAYLY